MTSALNPFEPSSRSLLFPLRLQSERDLSSSGLGILSGGHGGVDPLQEDFRVNNTADESRLGVHTFPSLNLGRGGGVRVFLELTAPGLPDRTRTTLEWMAQEMQ